MNITNIRAYNIEHALRGMRNPKNSWDKSDSYFGLEFNDFENILARTHEQEYKIMHQDNDIVEFASVGPNDMKLVRSLVKGGPEHRKFMRQIFVTADITAPLYLWKEVDTYKISTTANSTSTMHTLANTSITLEHFETDDYNKLIEDINIDAHVEDTIKFLEHLRQMFLTTGDKRYWKELIRWLPEGWSQTRTWTANYEVVYNMEHQRKNHKLGLEWSYVLDKLTDLPYYKEFTR